MITIDCPKAMVVLSPVAVVIGNDHPVFRSGRSYDDLFMVGVHYCCTDISYQQTDCVVCHLETILQNFGTVPCRHVAESDGYLQSWIQRLAVIRVELANQGCQPVHHLLKHCRFVPDKVLESGRIFNPQFHYKMLKLPKRRSSQQRRSTPPSSLPPQPALTNDLLMLMLDRYNILLDRLMELMPGQVIVCELDP